MPQTRETIDAETMLVALLGWPVKHSASPRFHNAALEALGINATYMAFAVPPERFTDAFRGLQALGAVGANFTVPHKEAACSLCDELSPAAQVIEAVNTVKFEKGQAVGYNTDAYGIAAALAEEGLKFRGNNVVILGAGGSARGIITQAFLDGAARLTVANRTVPRAEQLVAHLLEKCRQLKPAERKHPLPTCMVVPYDDIKAALRDADVLINATSVGLKKDDPPLFNPALISPATFVYDTIYNPAQTQLLIEAKQHGCRRTANGLTMLLHQGARAFEIWFGRKAPLQLMRNELFDPSAWSRKKA